jgi:hypothetical protein
MKSKFEEAISLSKKEKLFLSGLLTKRGLKKASLLRKERLERDFLPGLVLFYTI